MEVETLISLFEAAESLDWHRQGLLLVIYFLIASTQRLALWGRETALSEVLILQCLALGHRAIGRIDGLATKPDSPVFLALVIERQVDL